MQFSAKQILCCATKIPDQLSPYTKIKVVKKTIFVKLMIIEKMQDLQNYMYPHDKEIEAVGVRGIYLNNYIRWDSKAQHEKMIELYRYESNAQQRTFDTYNDID